MLAFVKRLLGRTNLADAIGADSSMAQAIPSVSRCVCYVGDYTVLTTTVFGHKMFVDSRDVSLSPFIISDGHWELWISNFIRSTLRSGMTAVEIGSNCGYYSVLIADLIGKKGKLFAFDANPRMYELTHKNLEMNGFRERSRVFNKAVSDREGIAKFFVFRDHLGSSSLYDLSVLAEQYGDKAEAIEVETVRLQDAIGEDVVVDFLKIDAEGSERQIFDAAWPLIEKSREIQIVVEYAVGNFPSMDVATSYLSRFVAEGFLLRQIVPDSKPVLVTIDDLLKLEWGELYLSRS
jgi:FkbM family methyltransferase